MHYIEVKNVSQIYSVGNEPVNALTNISFAIEKGEFIAVTGPSGCGKSTLLHMIGGLSKPSSGQILNCGVSLYEKRNSEISLFRRREVGIVYQFYNLVQNLTALENVELASQICREPMDAREALRAVGLEERMNNFPAQLSGGEQQRVAIARALAKNPKLLLCDEPTGALDYLTGKNILSLLHSTCRRMGMTVVVITHNQAITQMADRVISVKNGRVVDMSVNKEPLAPELIEW